MATGSFATAQSVFSTGFESSEGYRMEDVSGQNGWVTDVGAASVVGGPVFSGDGALQLWPGSSVLREGPAASGKVVFRARILEAQSRAPELPIHGQAVVLYVDPVRGLTGLDGDGGGGGRWVGSGIFAGADGWLGLEVELDFVTKTYGCRVDGRPVLWGLGFGDSDVAALHVVRLGSNVPEGNDTGRGVVVDDVGWEMLPEGPVGGGGEWAADRLGTGFEVGEGFAQGNLDGQRGWSVVAGNAEVGSQRVFSGRQAAVVNGGGGIVARSFEAVSGIVEFRSWIQASATDRPEVPTLGQAVVLYWDKTLGLTGLDGTGRGTGTWVSSGVNLVPGEWLELLVRADVVAKTWEAHVNGRPALVGLGFHSAGVASLADVQITSGPLAAQQTVLDDVSVRGMGLAVSPVGSTGMAGGALAGTGFEVSEGFGLGDLDGQVGWNVTGGVAEVWNQTVFSGRQAARIGPSGTVERTVSALGGVVTLDAVLQAVPCSMPSLPESARLAAMYLDPVTGITGLSGDGQGGARWVGSGFSVTAGSWFRARVSMDFTTGKWGCSIDGRPVLVGLDLQSRDVVALTSLVFGASPDGVTLVDDVAWAVSDPVQVVPTLSVSWSTERLEITWPVAEGVGFQLQASEDLGGAWTEVPVVGNRWVEPLDATTPRPVARFFRLATPVGVGVVPVDPPILPPRH